MVAPLVASVFKSSAPRSVSIMERDRLYHGFARCSNRVCRSLDYDALYLNVPYCKMLISYLRFRGGV